jgi:putative transposase
VKSRIKTIFHVITKGKMKVTRFTESQIVAILKQQDSGQTVAQITREHGISEATFYNWRAKYGGMQVSEVKRLKELEEENRRLKNGAARADVCRTEFAKRNYQRGIGKKVVGPAERRGVVRWLIDQKRISHRKACRWVGLSRNALAEPAVIKQKDKVLSSQIEQLARRHKHWGVLKIYGRLRKLGELVNHKRQGRLCGQTFVQKVRLKFTAKDKETLTRYCTSAATQSNGL